MSDPIPGRQASVNKIFGDSLPETTTDEWAERPPEGDSDRDHWLRENVPPHHG